jgi:2'-5' RNA ligase
MRLFIAILCDETFRESLLQAREKLRQHGGKGVPEENLHLTLAFLGETQRVEAVREAMEEACTGGSFSLTLSGSGQFGSMYWAGVEECPPLMRLAQRLTEALRKRGFFLEERAFHPHITLARGVRVSPPEPLLVPEKTMTVSRVSLMRSEPGENAMVYTELFSKTLSSL